LCTPGMSARKMYSRSRSMKSTGMVLQAGFEGTLQLPRSTKRATWNVHHQLAHRFCMFFSEPPGVSGAVADGAGSSACSARTTPAAAGVQSTTSVSLRARRPSLRIRPTSEHRREKVFKLVGSKAHKRHGCSYLGTQEFVGLAAVVRHQPSQTSTTLPSEGVAAEKATCEPRHLPGDRCGAGASKDREQMEAATFVNAPFVTAVDRALAIR
jgi:hypothetical protein